MFLDPIFAAVPAGQLFHPIYLVTGVISGLLECLSALSQRCDIPPRIWIVLAAVRGEAFLDRATIDILAFFEEATFSFVVGGRLLFDI
jgi:hypothetical protein